VKPPKTVQVGPYTFTLQPTPDLLDTGKVGDCDEAKALIRYVPDIDPIMLRSVIVHEILHACALMAGIAVTDKLDHETFVHRVEPMLLSVLRSNPDLLTWITA